MIEQVHVVIDQREIRNDIGEVVGGWRLYSNGETCQWYCPYIPLSFSRPKEIDWLAINREFS